MKLEFMKYEIDDAIVKEAARCKWNHACLNEIGDPLCTIDHCVMHKIYYSNCGHDSPCPHKSMLNESSVCTCPVRQEIFNKYGE